MLFFPLRSIVCSLIVPLVFTAFSPASQHTADWLGGPGAWTDPPHWSNGAIPNNSGEDTFHVYIDHGLAIASEVTLDAPVTIDAMSIDSIDSLKITSGGGISLDASAGGAAIDNSGLLRLEEGQIRVIVGDLLLTGGGRVSLSNSPNNALNGTGNEPRLLNQDQVISGGGNIGQNSLNVVNRSSIIATEATPLVIDPFVGGVVNSGILKAQQGGHLILTDGSFTNQEGGQRGTIIADHSLVEITGTASNHTTVNGGKIQVESSGEIQLAYADIVASTIQNSSKGILRVPTMKKASINGHLNNPPGGRVIIENRSSLRLASTGTYINDGDIQFQAESGLTTLQLDNSPTTINGRGRILLGPQFGAQISGLGPFINNGNTIEGRGGIYSRFTNRGTVRANQPFQLDLGFASPLVNSGIIEAVDGGSLFLPSSAIQNTENGIDGIIRAKNGGVVNFHGTINGGILEALAGGAFESPTALNNVKLRIYDGGIVHLSSYLNATNTQTAVDAGGQININNNGSWMAYGPTTMTHHGIIRLGNAASAGAIQAYGDLTISGDGEIDMTGNSTNTIYTDGNHRTLTFDGPALHGQGRIGSLGGASWETMINKGKIVADQVATLKISPSTVTPLAFQNYGQLIASGSGGLTFTSLVHSWGTVSILSGSQLILALGSLRVMDGSAVVNGPITNTAPAGTYALLLEGGTLSGDSSIQANTKNSSIVSPGSPIGVLTFTRDYLQMSTGVLSIEIGGLSVGTQYDRLSVGGTATLDGTLKVEFVNGFEPNIGDNFTIMTYPSKTGAFATIDVPSLPGKVVQATVGTTNVVVSVAAAAEGFGHRSENPSVLESIFDAFIP